MASNTKAVGTRERILGVAESIILNHGFSATSIDDIIKNAAITKGGFFYHFNGKKDLARALIERYLEQDNRIFDELFLLADQSSDDPLQQLLAFLGLFADMLENLDETHPGCLVAGFTYESQQFDEEIRELIKQGVLVWRKLIQIRLDKIADKYPMNTDVSIIALADMFTSCVEGGIILSRIFMSNNSLVQQVLLYREFLRLAFAHKTP
ncbi:MAG: TetR family transcriptional regulator [Pseudomonadales bacterium]|jgi:TetR/AcrR family transcriptional regulator, transcriptional repressor for nem operon|uniref:TetR/AcrR family transcriptional regulator n=1 Tax=unclassified Ketobacter TaxID=2639109 RepID=UPI000C67CC0F|nr:MULTISPECIES: TetR/AcrR family transcriptional regulator [unclassified Ketobacter]MAQ25768.1 TetR family transcriptional regulator [Pseudomonadales bacterium]MEC8811011.1 TetR/AcrR family transcriptional regulator [Pseudomonadota bacterium]TNC88727.1 MAG: TetR family transcriptional regulator [Alcanivorax sp.]HAU12295.1 TetR/AcrR family transcriptional regulator [Gammaproteobacteria bacterium]MBI28129.1 TetR family transcriptional regulator [Pseudomonadales bacterium]|tara:strand:- start:1363 stop:1989 length:627 start_codon:yes stop_codon:yes gene_type:complete